VVEWIDDAAAIPIPFRQVPAAGRVATGFDTICRSLTVVRRELTEEREFAATTAGAPETFSGSFADPLEQLANSREAARRVYQSAAEGPGRRQRPTVVTGHSLGGALTRTRPFVLGNSPKHKFDITTLCTFARRASATGNSRGYSGNCRSIRGGS
jgi:hypothetical protein